MREKPSPRMNNPNKIIAHCQNTKLGYFDSIFSTTSFEGEGMPRRQKKAKMKITPPIRPSMARKKDSAL